MQINTARASLNLQTLKTNPQEFQTQYLLHGGYWNVFEQGTGTPIVFLHNGGGTLWNWAYQLEYFSATYRVIAPDLPGFGRSHRPFTPLTLDHYVEGLSELLEVLSCYKPILVGNCIGASIALEFALRYPEKISALALFNVCGGLPMLNPQLQFWASLRPSTTFGRSLHSHMINAANHPRLQHLGKKFLYAGSEPELHSLIKQHIQQEYIDPNLRASLYWLVMGLDSFNIFSQPCQRPIHFPPVMLSWGRQNRTLAPHWANMIAGWLAPEHFWMIEDTGHFPMYEKPNQINEMLENFLKHL